MILYGYGKCSTCKKAVDFLNQKKVKFTFKEIKEHPPSVEELQKMLYYANGNLKKLFNTSGDLYRELKLSEKLDSMPLHEALELLADHGMLVKRPFLLGEDFGLTGFKEIEWMKIIK